MREAPEDAIARQGERDPLRLNAEKCERQLGKTMFGSSESTVQDTEASDRVLTT